MNPVRRVFWLLTPVFSLCILSQAAMCLADEKATDWPNFRGRDNNGLANGFETVSDWDTNKKNPKSVLWRIGVPGLGHSSPVVAGNCLYIASAISDAGDAKLQIGRSGGTAAADDNGVQSWVVLCYDKRTGKELWRQIAHRGVPEATRHVKATHANTSVSVLGDNVVAFFGSEGLFCFSLNGELKWKKDIGRVDISKYGIGWGYASSPAVYEQHIVVVCDDPQNPFIAAFSIEDGQELWRRSRKGDCERSWGTPLIHSVNGRSQVVVNGWPWIVSYDLSTGDEIWRIEGGGDNPIPSPFLVNGRIFVTSSHGGRSPIIALKSEAKGNLTEAKSPEEAGLAWRVEKGGAYMATPVVVKDYLYVGDSRGVLRCYEATSGKLKYAHRLSNNAYLVASLVAAGDKIYCASEDGTVFVVAAGPEFRLISKNQLGEPCLATPAISEGVIFFRTSKSLLAIGTTPHPKNDLSTVEEQRKNILFIAVDDLRPSLGCYGDPIAISPNIDRLAGRGRVFNRAYCQVAVCNPSRASLMTGLRPDTLGVWTLPIHFREAKPNAVTLPQWLRKHGYQAISHGKIFHNPTPDPQSWSEPIKKLPPLPFPYPPQTRDLINESMQQLPPGDWRKNNLRAPATAAPQIEDQKLLDGARTQMCIEDLRRLAKQKEPFFLAMGFIRPHLAFVAPKKYWDLYDPSKLPVLSDQRVPQNAPKFAMHNNSEITHYVDMMNTPTPWDDREVEPATARRIVHGYYACVSYVDAQIGRLLDTLEEEGLAENTIVVLWSDHGYKLGDYRGWGKMTNLEIDTRVPLIIAAPNVCQHAGQTTEALVELLDIFPTLCELVNVETPEFVEGKSLVPLLESPSARVHDAAVSQYYRSVDGQQIMGYALRTDNARYVEWRDFESGTLIEQELYAHPGPSQSHLGHRETENRFAQSDRTVVEGLRKRLAATHPPRKLSMLPAVHSSPSGRLRLQVRFTVKNEAEVEITVYPITPKGRRSRGKKILPGNSMSMNARLGGVFVVESSDGKIHQIHSPNWPSTPVIIRPTTAPLELNGKGEAK